MLVLSREINERLRIGDNIWITVVRIQGGKVRLGIQAPPDVVVHREEVLEQIEQEALSRAAGLTTSDADPTLVAD